MDKKVKVIDGMGREIEVEQIADIHLKDKNYLIYTLNETHDDNVRLYVSEVIENGDNLELVDVDNNDWDELKKEINKLLGKC